MKDGSATGYDIILPEFLKHLGPKAKSCLASFYMRITGEKKDVASGKSHRHPETQQEPKSRGQLPPNILATRGVNQIVCHVSIQYRFSYPAIRYLPIPQKILRYDSIRYRSILIDIMILYTHFKQPSTLVVGASFMLALCLHYIYILISSPDT